MTMSGEIFNVNAVLKTNDEVKCLTSGKLVGYLVLRYTLAASCMVDNCTNYSPKSQPFDCAYFTN